MTRKSTRKKRVRRLAEVVDALIAKAMASVRGKQMKATVADLFRATDMQRELFPPKETPRNARWVDRWRVK